MVDTHSELRTNAIPSISSIASSSFSALALRPTHHVYFATNMIQHCQCPSQRKHVVTYVFVTKITRAENRVGSALRSAEAITDPGTAVASAPAPPVERRPCSFRPHPSTQRLVSDQWLTVLPQSMHTALKVGLKARNQLDRYEHAPTAFGVSNPLPWGTKEASSAAADAPVSSVVDSDSSRLLILSPSCESLLDSCENVLRILSGPFLTSLTEDVRDSGVCCTWDSSVAKSVI